MVVLLGRYSELVLTGGKSQRGYRVQVAREFVWRGRSEEYQSEDLLILVNSLQLQGILNIRHFKVLCRREKTTSSFFVFIFKSNSRSLFIVPFHYFGT